MRRQTLRRRPRGRGTVLLSTATAAVHRRCSRIVDNCVGSLPPLELSTIHYGRGTDRLIQLIEEHALEGGKLGVIAEIRFT